MRKHKSLLLCHGHYDISVTNQTYCQGTGMAKGLVVSEKEIKE